jgi:CubicO group peptidase (beta-lactamase class C family)
MKRGFIIAAVLAIILAGTIVVLKPGLSIQIASGATSRYICTKTFVSGLKPEDIYAQDVRPEPGMGLIDWALRFDVDRVRRDVRTTVQGLFESRSVYRDGLGCVLVHAGDKPIELAPAAASDAVPALLPEIAGSEPVAGDPTLQAAIDGAFVEPASGPKRWTQAVVIVHDGRVIGERYAPGYGVGTPLLSQSIAKSVVNALIGILVRDGKLSIASRVPLVGRGADGDAGDGATVDQLLRMSSGLPLDGRIGRSAGRMSFIEPDTATFAQAARLVATPGTRWAYSNLGYALLSRIVRDVIKGDERAIRDFAQHELFGPLGMRHVTMEFDAVGTPAGSNAMLATARDWAKFGLLYLNDGVVAGRRILSEGWVAYSTKQTLDAGYGAGFWLNVTHAPTTPWGLPWGLPGAPSDAYFGRGYLGQYLIIGPSEHLIVVRFGALHGPGGDAEGAGALVRDVIAALR